MRVSESVSPYTKTYPFPDPIGVSRAGLRASPVLETPDGKPLLITHVREEGMSGPRKLLISVYKVKTGSRDSTRDVT